MRGDWKLSSGRVVGRHKVSSERMLGKTKWETMEEDKNIASPIKSSESGKRRASIYEADA